MRLLEAASALPDVPLHELEILSAEERRTLLEEFNDTTRLIPETTLPALFEAQVAQAPCALAVVCKDESVTYEELNARANRLAHHLIKLGVGPEKFVGICLERSVEMVVAMLATLKAGGAYLPLDPQYPEARLALMAGDAAPAVVLSTCELRNRLLSAFEVLCLDGSHTRIALAQSPAHDPIDLCRTCKLQPQHPAYVIYTSGSTGTPKGVIVTHGSVTSLSAWAKGEFGPEDLSGVLASTSICFDFSVFELLVTLALGGRVILADNVLHLENLAPWARVSVMNTIPSAASALLEMDGVPEGVRTINLGGEPLRNSLVQRLYRRTSVERVFNLYGPTECTVCSTSTVCPRSSDEEPPIGSPLRGTRAYVLDGALQRVPVGVAGELYISGWGLARGYLNQPALTSERFVADPYSPAPGSRMYRTGDLVRWRGDGKLEFLGRIDQQVKLRGFRIEPGEIEVVLGRIGASQAAVVVREDDPAGKQLVAYVLPPCGVPLDRAALRRELAARLPDYMVPSAIVVLEKLPLTSSGKLDRKALPAPDQRAETYRPPRTPEEQILCELFGAVLSLATVGIDDDFFELGGHSLLAMRLVSRVRAALGIELPIRAIFEAPTAAGLAARLQSSEAARPPLVRQPRPARLPLSAAQTRLWFIDRLEETSTEYNMPEALRLRGKLDQHALKRTLQAIVERHESLRTHFVELDGEPAQFIVPELQIDVPLEDLSVLDEAAAQAIIASAVRREWDEPFDLSRGPLLRMKLLRLGEGDHLLLRTCHHIVSDGWSRGLFNREFAELYAAFRAGRESPLAPLPVQYADFTLWQRTWLSGEALQRGLDYWRAQLASIPQRLELATDRPRPALQTYAAAICHATIPCRPWRMCGG